MSERDFPALAESVRRYDAAFHLMEGLNETYLECANSGRLEVWADAAHAIIRLIVSRAPTVFENDPSAAQQVSTPSSSVEGVVGRTSQPHVARDPAPAITDQPHSDGEG